MQVRALIILLIAVLLGGLAVYLVQNVLAPPPEEEVEVVAPGPEMAEVVIAATDLEVGTRLEPVMLEAVAFPVEAVPEGAYSSVQAVMREEEERGPVVIRDMRQGEVVLPHRISPPGARAGLTVKIPDDMRAVTISTDEIQGVAGFVLPGDRVDVLHTTTAGRADGQLVTRTLLQNLKVLGVDQKASEDEDDPHVARAVTLLATPEEAQKVTLAQRVGQVKLALRSELDGEELVPRVIRLVDLQTPPPAARASASPSAPPAPPRQRVEVIRGLSVETDSVDIDDPADDGPADGQPAWGQ